FFARHRVELTCSLPYYLAEQTDAQRGSGVFDKSVAALRRLNAIGYGMEPGNLILNLVYNPVGAFLPPPQAAMETDFKREMMARYGITFNHLFTLTNMPINRFLEYLRRSGNEMRYLWKLARSFNPGTVEGLMCRSLISVDWRGRLYDCDFNQMLGLGVEAGLPQMIGHLDMEELGKRSIQTGRHCFGCTAGAGSSCGGALVKTSDV
ncbi:MAG TPA: DUF3641 domain-containing protein, partial [Blastocatellia bacterium]|nr:DUF3641 domain-containing protein [Blastocatellia bacterium]